MKYVLLTIFFVTLSNLVFGSEVIRYSTLEFKKDISLRDGQKSVLIANGKCRLYLHKEAIGNQRIMAGDYLTILDIKYEGERDSYNPVTGDPIKVLPYVKMSLIDTKATITCRGKDSRKISVSDFEADGLFRVGLPEETIYEF